LYKRYTDFFNFISEFHKKNTKIILILFPVMPVVFAGFYPKIEMFLETIISLIIINDIG